jgi:hypothetical protein
VRPAPLVLMKCSRRGRGDDYLRSSAEIPQHMADLDLCMPEDPRSAPLSRAFGVDGTFWDYLAAPGNESRQAAFTAGMVTYDRTFPPDLILDGVLTRSFPIPFLTRSRS